MQIAFYAPLKSPDHEIPSGDREMARRLITALRMAGHKTFIASRLRSWEGKGDYTKQHRIKKRGRNIARRYIENHIHHPPDLWFTYHLYHKAPDWIGPFVADAFRIPYVVAEASYSPKQAEGPWEHGHNAVSTALFRADHVISLNPADIECVLPKLKGHCQLTAMLPFIDTKQPLLAIKEGNRFRSKLAIDLNINPGIPWLVTTAMMRDGDKVKSYQILGKLLKHLYDIDWVLIVIGDGPARERVESILGKDSRIRYLGIQSRKQIFRINAAADLFCWPAINEAYGMALLEAQASGLPVVAGFGPGVAQIVENGRTGLLGLASNPEELAKLVRRLLCSPDRRNLMHLASLDKTASTHDISKAAQKLNHIVRDTHFKG